MDTAKDGNVRKTDAQWTRIQELNRRRVLAKGFANRTDAVRRGAKGRAR